MDRTYTIPCQKNNFRSCEGCPKMECEKIIIQGPTSLKTTKRTGKPSTAEFLL